MEVLTDLHESLKRDGKQTYLGSQFQPIIKAFNYAKDNNIPVLLETAEIANPSSVVVSIDFVGPRFARGTTDYKYYDGDTLVTINVPYTINYVDLIQTEHRRADVTTVSFKGYNPFWELLEEGYNAQV